MSITPGPEVSGSVAIRLGDDDLDAFSDDIAAMCMIGKAALCGNELWVFAEDAAGVNSKIGA